MASTELLTAIMALLLDVGERQRATLAKMVVAAWLAGSMTITTLARAAAIRFLQQPRTLHKAFDRAIGSVAIDPMEIYRSHARRVLHGHRVVRVAIDWLSLRNDSMRVLLSAVCDDQGRATPLLAYHWTATTVRGPDGTVGATVVSNAQWIPTTTLNSGQRQALQTRWGGFLDRAPYFRRLLQ